MKKFIVSILFFVLFISVCSDAPEVVFPEPADRIVLAELFTEDG